MVTGYILVEGMRVGAGLEGPPLRLLKIERHRVPTASPMQPGVWTTVAFEFDEHDASASRPPCRRKSSRRRAAGTRTSPSTERWS